MAVGAANTAFRTVPGVRLASVPCGIKSEDEPDLVLFEFAPGSVTAGIFTQNLFAAAPVRVAQAHLAKKDSRYFLINSGNANAATGEAGKSDAQACCLALSQLTGAHPDEVVPFSTGVIGERLPAERIIDALPGLQASLRADNWLSAACGIMTTDTRPKIASRDFSVRGQRVTLTGIAKGAGMIQPDMATMLAYIATDAQVSRRPLQRALLLGAEQSFNRITVDGDTSTNDACMLTATGASGVSCDAGDAGERFQQALNALMRELACGIVRDAEGATRFVTITVRNGKTDADSLSVARSVANSPLVKTALFAGDANWGRVVMAIGKSGADLEPSKVDLYLDDVKLLAAGGKDKAYREEAGAAVMRREEITITVDLNQGRAVQTLWTCDLSHDYIAINADYRT